MRRFRLHLVRLLLAVASLPVALAQQAGQVTMTGNLTVNGASSVRIQLVNCGNNHGRAEYQGSFVTTLIQTTWTPTISSGTFTQYVWPNDLISCGGSTDTSEYQVTYLQNGVPVGQPETYQVLSTGPSTFNLTQQVPLNSLPPAPTPNYDMPLTGGTFNGPIYLNADPTSNLQAATKRYVDNAQSAAETYAASGSANDSTARATATAAVPLAGGSPTGPIVSSSYYKESTVILGGTAQQYLQPWVVTLTPQAFGAKADDITDDGPALQACFNFASSTGGTCNLKGPVTAVNTGAGTHAFSTGYRTVYRTLEQLRIPTSTDIEGAGDNIDIIDSWYNGYAMYWDESTTPNQHGTLRGFSIGNTDPSLATNEPLFGGIQSVPNQTLSNGGLWFQRIQDVYIYNEARSCEVMYGAADGFLLPQQYIQHYGFKCQPQDVLHAVTQVTYTVTAVAAPNPGGSKFAAYTVSGAVYTTGGATVALATLANNGIAGERVAVSGCTTPANNSGATPFTVVNSSYSGSTATITVLNGSSVAESETGCSAISQADNIPIIDLRAQVQSSVWAAGTILGPSRADANIPVEISGTPLDPANNITPGEDSFENFGPQYGQVGFYCYQCNSLQLINSDLEGLSQPLDIQFSNNMTFENLRVANSGDGYVSGGSTYGGILQSNSSSFIYKNIKVDDSSVSLYQNTAAFCTNWNNGNFIGPIGGGITSNCYAQSVSVPVPPTATISGGGGTGATMSLTVASGVITACSISAAGSGYTSTPTVAVADSSGGSGASITVTTSSGAVSGCTVVSGGSGYQTLSLNASGNRVIGDGGTNPIPTISSNAGPGQDTTLWAQTSSFCLTGTGGNILLGNTMTQVCIPSGHSVVLRTTDYGGFYYRVVACSDSADCMPTPAYPGTANSWTAAQAFPAGSTVGGYGICDSNGDNCPSSNVVATINQNGLTANVSSTSLLSSATAGFYEISCYLVLTFKDPVSSTLPACEVNFTDGDTNTNLTQTFTSTSTTNTVANTNSLQAGGNTRVFYAKSATAINWLTTSYASNTSGTMTYAAHVKLRYLGN